MAVTRALVKLVEDRLGVKFLSYDKVSGGSINSTYALVTDKGKYFLKMNSNTRFPGMFAAEALGLHYIADTHTLPTPEVIFEGETGSDGFLLLEWIDTKSPDKTSSQLLGMQLAQMHRHTATHFGLDHDNYMGTFTQSNTKHANWAEFFIIQRLQPMVKQAVDLQGLSQTEAAQFETLYKHLPELFEEEPPALLHGDLWGGNYLIGTNNKPYLIDPAVSYGHREFDIAMTTLFGGFSNEFYLAYNEDYPFAKGWQQRVDLWNLYPLLVHLNLFGGSYKQQVMSCLRGFI